MLVPAAKIQLRVVPAHALLGMLGQKKVSTKHLLQSLSCITSPRSGKPPPARSTSAQRAARAEGLPAPNMQVIRTLSEAMVAAQHTYTKLFIVKHGRHAARAIGVIFAIFNRSTRDL